MERRFSPIPHIARTWPDGCRELARWQCGRARVLLRVCCRSTHFHFSIGPSSQAISTSRDRRGSRWLLDLESANYPAGTSRAAIRRERQLDGGALREETGLAQRETMARCIPHPIDERQPTVDARHLRRGNFRPAYCTGFRSRAASRLADRYLA
jgi:hypothetical protein